MIEKIYTGDQTTISEIIDKINEIVNEVNKQFTFHDIKGPKHPRDSILGPAFRDHTLDLQGIGLKSLTGKIDSIGK